MEEFMRKMQARGGVPGLGADFVKGLDPSNLPLDAVRVNMPRQPFRKLEDGATLDWSQSTGFTNLYIPSQGLRGRELDVRISKDKFSIGPRRGSPWLDGPTGGRVDVSNSGWELEDGEVRVNLAKMDHQEWIFAVRESKKAAHSKNRPVQSAAKISTKRPPPSAKPAQTPSLPTTSVPIAPSSATQASYKYAPKKIDSKTAAAAKPKSKSKGKWDNLDVDQVLADIENEDASDEPAWRVTKKPGLATVNVEGYKKSKEEVALDHDLKSATSKLKSMIRTRLSQATELKDRGNTRAKAKDFGGAKPLYEEACAMLGVVETATVLMSQTLKTRVEALSLSLNNNLALCHLKLNEFAEAKAYADKVIEKGKNYKALCRRASAAIGMGDRAAAKRDLEAAVKAQRNCAEAKRLLKGLGDTS